MNCEKTNDELLASREPIVLLPDGQLQCMACENIAPHEAMEASPPPTQEQIDLARSFLDSVEFEKADETEGGFSLKPTEHWYLTLACLLATERGAGDRVLGRLVDAAKIIRGLVTQFDHSGCTCTFPSDDCCAYARAQKWLSA